MNANAAPELVELEVRTTEVVAIQAIKEMSEEHAGRIEHDVLEPTASFDSERIPDSHFRSSDKLSETSYATLYAINYSAIT